MYAIAQVIYGIPLEKPKGILEDLVDADDRDTGFLTYYSGGGDATPAAFGVELDTFDEACFHLEVSKLRLEPTKAQVAKYNRLFKALDPEVQEALQLIGKPRAIILWTTS